MAVFSLPITLDSGLKRKFACATVVTVSYRQEGRLTRARGLLSRARKWAGPTTKTGKTNKPPFSPNMRNRQSKRILCEYVFTQIQHLFILQLSVIEMNCELRFFSQTKEIHFERNKGEAKRIKERKKRWVDLTKTKSGPGQRRCSKTRGLIFCPTNTLTKRHLKLSRNGQTKKEK